MSLHIYGMHAWVPLLCLLPLALCARTAVGMRSTSELLHVLQEDRASSSGSLPIHPCKTGADHEGKVGPSPESEGGGPVVAALPIPLCEFDTDCPDSEVCASNGKCMTPCQRKNFEDPHSEPRLKCYATKEELLADTWCTPRPGSAEAEEMPRHLHGLYWTKGADLPEVAFCHSLGQWTSDGFGSLELGTYQWVYNDTRRGLEMAEASYAFRDFVYEVRFADQRRTAATITFKGGFKAALSNLGGWLLGFKLYLIEIAGFADGERFGRPNYAFNWRVKQETAGKNPNAYYEPWRLYRSMPGGEPEQNAESVKAFLGASSSSGFFRQLAPWEV